MIILTFFAPLVLLNLIIAISLKGLRYPLRLFLYPGYLMILPMAATLVRFCCQLPKSLFISETPTLALTFLRLHSINNSSHDFLDTNLVSVRRLSGRSSKQWAAVRTKSGAMRVPPQKLFQPSSGRRFWNGKCYSVKKFHSCVLSKKLTWVNDTMNGRAPSGTSFPPSTNWTSPGNLIIVSVHLRFCVYVKWEW